MENIENKLEFAEKIETLKNEIRKNIIGQENLIENIVIALLTDGHILLE
jgi:MoxR-like ATPase